MIEKSGKEKLKVSTQELLKNQGYPLKVRQEILNWYAIKRDQTREIATEKTAVVMEYV